MKFICLVPLTWVNCFVSGAPSIPEDVNVNEMKRFGWMSLGSSFLYEYPNGSLEFLIEFGNSEVEWRKGDLF